MSSEILAWHFLPEDRRLRWGTKEEVRAGSVLRETPPLAMCANGFHASVKALDALGYAPGPIVSRVVLRGEMLTDRDKVCALEREHLWIADATHVLREFACRCAEQALNRERAAGREPDERSWRAIEVARRFNEGQASKEQLEAAWFAAWAPQAAAWGAARAAAESAAESTAWDAFRAAGAAASAAQEAAWGRAGAAGEALEAREASRKEQNSLLQEMLLTLSPAGEKGGE